MAGTESVIHTFRGVGVGVGLGLGVGLESVIQTFRVRGSATVRARARVSEPHLLEERRRAILAQEAPPALLREDAVGDEARDHARPRLGSVVSNE